MACNKIKNVITSNLDEKSDLTHILRNLMCFKFALHKLTDNEIKKIVKIL